MACTTDTGDASEARPTLTRPAPLSMTTGAGEVIALRDETRSADVVPIFGRNRCAPWKPGMSRLMGMRAQFQAKLDQEKQQLRARNVSEPEPVR